jgi:L-lysine exporter family protein LysE/ArgO
MSSCCARIVRSRFGAIFLASYAIPAFRRAMKSQTLTAPAENGMTLKVAIATCLAFTFLNPHVYLNTVLLLASLLAAYQGAARVTYGFGAVIASFMRFFALGYGARLLQPIFAKPAAWRVPNAIVGAVMTLLALSLLTRFASGG